jgi:hypothetical protein
MEEGWKTGKTALQILFIILSIAAGVVVVGGAGYVRNGIGAAVLLSVPYYGRWRTEDSTRRIVMLSIAWPVAILVSWYIIMNEERWRKERIAHDVMES